MSEPSGFGRMESQRHWTALFVTAAGDWSSSVGGGTPTLSKGFEIGLQRHHKVLNDDHDQQDWSKEPGTYYGGLVCYCIRFILLYDLEECGGRGGPAGR